MQHPECPPCHSACRKWTLLSSCSSTLLCCCHGPHNPFQKNIFTSSKEKLHDAFLGSGDYKDLILQNGMFGLGFKRVEVTDGSVIGFGHAGLGGSTAYCDINNRLANSVTINKLSLGALTWEIICFIYSELDLPIPQDYAESRDFIEEPKIN
ncbi:hypothetical protein Tco_0502638 [Tanacetum coccineum]